MKAIKPPKSSAAATPPNKAEAKPKAKSQRRPSGWVSGRVSELAGKPSPTSYHHGNLRAALIDAGLHALEAKNDEELSLRELARQVGVSANAAYRHFASKEALLSALAAEGFRRLDSAQAQAAAKRKRAEAGFRAAGRAYVQFAMDNPALFRLMFGRFTSASGQRDPELMEASVAGFMALLNTVAGLGKQPADPHRALPHALLAWGIVHGLSHLALGGQLDYFGIEKDKLIETVLDLVKTPS